MEHIIRGRIKTTKNNVLTVEVQDITPEFTPAPPVVTLFDYRDSPSPKAGEWIVASVYFLTPSKADVKCAQIELDESEFTATRILHTIAKTRRWPKAVIPKLFTFLNEVAEVNKCAYLSHVTSKKDVDLLTDTFNAKIATDIVSGWRWHFFRRKLELFTLSSEEIYQLSQTWAMGDILTQIKLDPYPLLELSIKRCEDIMARFSWYYPDIIDPTPGHIARFILHRLIKWHHTHVSLTDLRANYPDIEMYLEVLTDAPYNLHLFKDNLYLPYAFKTEQTVALSLNRLFSLPTGPGYERLLFATKLCNEQLDALNDMLKHRVCLLQGGAGTGKTTLIAELARQYQARKLDTLIVSFTGRAVHVLRKKTEFKNVSTIHRALKGEGKCNYTIKAIIIDEVSMCPLALLARLLAHYPMLEYLALIGDINQLPPIDWCGFMAGLLDINRIKPIYLHENHRTVKSSDGTNAILDNANQIVNDTTKQVMITPGSNLWWFEPDESDLTALIERLAKTYVGTDVTVIVPFRASAKALNVVCQQVFNPAGPREYLDKDKVIWRVGDRVMLGKNINPLGINNGDEGKITKISSDRLTVKFELGEHEFLFAQTSPNSQDDFDPELELTEDDGVVLTLNLLSHCWALTCHKAQGSEWPIVIIYLPQSSAFITRQLMYVAMTRAQEKLYIFSSGPAMYASLNNLTPAPKTSLSNFLAQE